MAELKFEFMSDSKDPAPLSKPLCVTSFLASRLLPLGVLMRARFSVVVDIALKRKGFSSSFLPKV